MILYIGMKKMGETRTTGSGESEAGLGGLRGELRVMPTWPLLGSLGPHSDLCPTTPQL